MDREGGQFPLSYLYDDPLSLSFPFSLKPLPPSPPLLPSPPFHSPLPSSPPPLPPPPLLPPPSPPSPPPPSPPPLPPPPPPPPPPLSPPFPPPPPLPPPLLSPPPPSLPLPHPPPPPPSFDPVRMKLPAWRLMTGFADFASPPRPPLDGRAGTQRLTRGRLNRLVCCRSDWRLPPDTFVSPPSRPRAADGVGVQDASQTRAGMALCCVDMASSSKRDQVAKRGPPAAPPGRAATPAERSAVCVTGPALRRTVDRS